MRVSPSRSAGVGGASAIVGIPAVRCPRLIAAGQRVDRRAGDHGRRLVLNDLNDGGGSIFGAGRPWHAGESADGRGILVPTRRPCVAASPCPEG
jgi:hypothetical protein